MALHNLAMGAQTVFKMCPGAGISYGAGIVNRTWGEHFRREAEKPKKPQREHCCTPSGLLLLETKPKGLSTGSPLWIDQSNVGLSILAPDGNQRRVVPTGGLSVCVQWFH